MGLIIEPKALTMQYGKGSSNKKSKQKRKEKQKENEGYSKPSKNSSGSKISLNSKGKKRKGKKCTYFNKPNHKESTCMKKQINLMAQVLHKNNLRNFIPEGAKKKEEYQAPKKGNHHALVAINSSSNSWIIDSGASHHMAMKE
jgi:hypothetical protein